VFSTISALRSTQRSGRRGVAEEIPTLVRQMSSENSRLGPKIHGDLLKLGFEGTVAGYRPQYSTDAQSEEPTRSIICSLAVQEIQEVAWPSLQRDTLDRVDLTT
jgi:hypothetical protein